MEKVKSKVQFLVNASKVLLARIRHVPMHSTQRKIGIVQVKENCEKIAIRVCKTQTAHWIRSLSKEKFRVGKKNRTKKHVHNIVIK